MTWTMSRSEALRQLTGVYGLPHDQAVRALAIAVQNGTDAEPTNGRGPVTIRATRNGKEQFTIEDGIPPEAVAGNARGRYNQKQTETNPRKGKTMPRGRKPTAPAPAETTEENGTRDYRAYAEKEPTATMVDFADWLREEVGDIDKMDATKIVALAGTLRMDFQRSDFNQTRRAERKAAREAAPEPEPEAPPKPARGRPKAAAGGTTGRRATAAPATAATRGRPRGRGRPPASKEEAPF